MNQKKLLQAYSPWMRRLAEFANETCLSQGDLLRLTEDMIDRNAGVIVLDGGHGKTRAEQIAPLTSRCRAILEEIKAARRCGAAIPNVNGFIFTNPDGSQTTKGQSEYQVGLALKETGVKKFTFPNYRDTTLTRSARQGINVDVAMKASGTRAFKWTNAMLIFNRTISQRPSARQNN